MQLPQPRPRCPTWVCCKLIGCCAERHARRRPQAGHAWPVGLPVPDARQVQGPDDEALGAARTPAPPAKGWAGRTGLKEGGRAAAGGGRGGAARQGGAIDAAAGAPSPMHDELLAAQLEALLDLLEGGRRCWGLLLVCILLRLKHCYPHGSGQCVPPGNTSPLCLYSDAAATARLASQRASPLTTLSQHGESTDLPCHRLPKISHSIVISEGLGVVLRRSWRHRCPPTSGGTPRTTWSGLGI